MPKQLSPSLAAPSFILEKLQLWAKAIRVQRVMQGLTADALCERMGISRSTMRRVERGEPTVATHVYLSALMVLGLLDSACPMLPEHLLQIPPPKSEQNRLRFLVRTTSRPQNDF